MPYRRAAMDYYDRDEQYNWAWTDQNQHYSALKPYEESEFTG
jgi:hypothetical protein